ncbi:MAG: hypothetical protein NHB32_21135 [Fischerella sp. CENA71]|nr:hypothetical protein [Fischerella sp. CENA71]
MGKIYKVAQFCSYLSKGMHRGFCGSIASRLFYLGYDIAELLIVLLCHALWFTLPYVIAKSCSNYRSIIISTGFYLHPPITMLPISLAIRRMGI